MIIASDASAILSHTRSVVYLDDGEMAVLLRLNAQTEAFEEALAYIAGHEGVWLATGREIAAHFKKQCPNHIGGEVVHLKP